MNLVPHLQRKQKERDGVSSAFEKDLVEGLVKLTKRRVYFKGIKDSRSD